VLLSSPMLFQRSTVVVLAGTLNHPCKMDDIARYLIHAFGSKKPMTSCKLVHLWEGVVCAEGRSGVFLGDGCRTFNFDGLSIVSIV